MKNHKTSQISHLGSKSATLPKDTKCEPETFLQPQGMKEEPDLDVEEAVIANVQTETHHADLCNPDIFADIRLQVVD